MTLTPPQIVTPALFSVMLALGLNLRPEAMHHWRTRPGLPLRVLLGSCLLVPLLAWLLLQTPWSEALSRPARHAIALMALCPSAPLALHKADKAGGDRQLAALLQISAALAAIVTIPLLGLAFRHTFQLEGWDVRPVDVALQVGRVQVLPLLLGMGLRWRWPLLAERIAPRLNQLANGLLLVLVVVVLIKAGPQLVFLLATNLLALPAMALIVAASLLIGAAMAADDGSERRTTALVSAMRNPGLALFFAGAHGKGLEGLKLLILGYVLVTLVLSIPLVRRSRRGESA